MSVFKKKINFTSAICPKCNGHLTLNSNMETAFCQQCGAQCIVTNAQKKAKKQGKLETILGFIERQQALHRQDKREKQRKIEEEERRQKEHVKRFWWAYALIGLAVTAFFIVMSILEKQGII